MFGNKIISKRSVAYGRFEWKCIENKKTKLYGKSKFYLIAWIRLHEKNIYSFFLKKVIEIQLIKGMRVFLLKTFLCFILLVWFVKKFPTFYYLINDRDRSSSEFLLLNPLDNLLVLFTLTCPSSIHFGDIEYSASASDTAMLAVDGSGCRSRSPAATVYGSSVGNTSSQYWSRISSGCSWCISSTIR